MNEFTRPTKSDIDLAIEGEYDSMPRVRRGGLRWGGRTPAGMKLVPDDKPAPLQIDIQVYAEYQLFGDIETDDWVARNLQTAKETDAIIDYECHYITVGTWGLRFIAFSINTRVDAGTQDQIRAQAQDVLFKLVGESDVELRYITML